MAKKITVHPQNKAQMELFSERPFELDRNFSQGGKSFYFFDFDDNIAYLATPIVLFNKKNGSELLVSSGQFARENKNIGQTGIYKDYFMDFNDRTGTFRNFRDLEEHELAPHSKQSFVRDIEDALNSKDYDWKAPSWNSFFYATYNKRPMSVITARGHKKQTIKDGISLMVRDGYLPHDPNFLSIYPVSNPNVRVELGDNDFRASVPELKRGAIRESVKTAIENYGYSPYHRFGMSDDDPKNVELITEEMRDLKRKFPEMSFFVIQTFKDSYVKNEILEHSTREVVSKNESKLDQLTLFTF